MLCLMYDIAANAVNSRLRILFYHFKNSADKGVGRVKKINFDSENKLLKNSIEKIIKKFYREN